MKTEHKEAVEQIEKNIVLQTHALAVWVTSSEDNVIRCHDAFRQILDVVDKAEPKRFFSKADVEQIRETCLKHVSGQKVKKQTLFGKVKTWIRDKWAVNVV